MWSPGCNQTGGVRKAPMPAGVPVAITSPGSSVMKALRYSISRATGNSMSAVWPCCICSPLTWQVKSSACGSAISSRVTSQGPIGQKPSMLLAKVVCAGLTSN